MQVLQVVLQMMQLMLRTIAIRSLRLQEIYPHILEPLARICLDFWFLYHE